MYVKEKRELKYPREQGFFDKSLVIRGLIGFLFFFSLVAFVHFREARTEMLEVNTLAERFIVSQIDFEFYDDEATIILQQEASRDIGKIFQLSEKDIRLCRVEFEKHLIFNQSWRKEAEASTFEEMYKGGDALEKALLAVRFTDTRTLNKMVQLQLNCSQYIVFIPPEGIASMLLTNDMLSVAQKIAFADDAFHEGTTSFITEYFRQKSFKFEEDKHSRRLVRKAVQDSVPRQYTRVNAGDRIIDQGEKVTMRHLMMLQAMKKALAESSNLWHPMTVSGSILMTAVYVVLGVLYLKERHPTVFRSNRKIFLLVLVIVMTLGLAKLTEGLLLSSTAKLFDVIRYPLFAPFSAILLCVLMNSEIALFVSGFLAVLMTMSLSVARAFMVVNVIASLVTVQSVRSLRSRRDVFLVCARAWVATSVLLFSIHLYNNTFPSTAILIDIFATFSFLLFTAILVVGILPLIESLFPIMTDALLMEFLDPNHELLVRLTMEAPGTYQHSMVVGTLSESAAQAIGANGLFCRVAAMYHDIGKLRNPQYFTENQQKGMNMHQLLTPKESAQVIIAHVADGVASARKAGLPEQFIDIIKEHHGTTQVYYFYRAQIELMGGDAQNVSEEDFRYTGPKPRSKESAIIMIADSLEAASRSLFEINEETVTELVEVLVKEKAEDGQFDECMLTFEELGIVKKSLIKTLVSASHSRISYAKE